MMDKLKTRLDAFSDAIIAIIITIIVLELPIPLHNSISEYLQFGKGIGIYFISFIFVANIWYQHSNLFNDAETMNERVFIMEFIFLAFLSLVPLFTRMVTQDTNRWTVMAYGMLTLIVNILFIILCNIVIKLKYTEHKDIQRIFNRVYGNQNNLITGTSIVLIILAYFQPNWALIFYLALPIISFLRTDDQADLDDITQLSTTEQNDYFKLSSADMRTFRKQQDEIRNKYVKQRKTNPNWKQDMRNEIGDILKDGITTADGQKIDGSTVRNFYNRFQQQQNVRKQNNRQRWQDHNQYVQNAPHNKRKNVNANERSNRASNDASRKVENTKKENKK